MSNSNTSKGVSTPQNEALYEITHGPAVYVVSFVVPLIIMCAIFMIRDIYPFGSSCYLRSDMYHQYCPFFSELWYKLRNGGSLSYSWDIGMGTNFLVIFGYYLSSITNFFIVLFPQKNMIEIMNVIIILKIAASSFTCTFYLCNHNRNRNMAAAIFGIFYGLSGFIAAYSWNLMWLDCVVLLPLVVLGLERLIKKGKGLLYVITLALTILSNYYIAIMVCLSMIIFFVVTLISNSAKDGWKNLTRAVLCFIFYSVLAGGLAAIILFPEMTALEYTASGSISFPKVLDRYFSFVTILQRHLINTPVSTGLDHLPNIYCGVGVFLLFPLYILTKSIPRREKIAKIAALVIFLTAFNLNIPNFIWHGFHFPNSLPCRQSFIYIFLLLSICYDALIHVKEEKDSRLSGCFWICAAFLLYLGNTLTNDDIDFRILYISAFFICIYFAGILLARKNNISKNILVLFIMAIAIIECTMNMDKTGYSVTSRTNYLEDYNTVDALTDEIEDLEGDNFYRVSKALGYRSKNDSAWHNFHGESTFSSTAYASLTKFFGELGLEHSTNSYAINGATPLIYSIFNVKYLLSNKELPTEPLTTLVDKNGSEYLYMNNYTLPLAFMVPEYFNSVFIHEDESNPFVVQNSFAEVAAETYNLFERIEFEDNDSSAVIMPDKDEYLYLYIMNKSIETINVTIDGNTETYRGINHGRMINIGYVSKDSIISVTNPGANSASLQMYAYTLNFDAFVDFYNKLADGGLNITSYSDTIIKGNVTAKENGLLFTSIPYDESYTIYVDGKKTEYTSTGDQAFIALPLSQGYHEIEFRYFPRGLKGGIIISAICLLTLIGLIVFRIKSKKEFSEKGAFIMPLSLNDNNIRHISHTNGKDDKK